MMSYCSSYRKLTQGYLQERETHLCSLHKAHDGDLPEVNTLLVGPAEPSRTQRQGTKIIYEEPKHLLSLTYPCSFFFFLLAVPLCSFTMIAQSDLIL